jgi:hypothetical protein
MWTACPLCARRAACTIVGVAEVLTENGWSFHHGSACALPFAFECNCSVMSPDGFEVASSTSKM